MRQNKTARAKYGSDDEQGSAQAEPLDLPSQVHSPPRRGSKGGTQSTPRMSPSAVPDEDDVAATLSKHLQEPVSIDDLPLSANFANWEPSSYVKQLWKPGGVKTATGPTGPTPVVYKKSPNVGAYAREYLARNVRANKARARSTKSRFAQS